MKHFHAVICDMDGLLLDTERIGLDTFIETCTAFTMAVDRNLYMRCVGTNVAMCLDVLRDGLEGGVDHVEFMRLWDEKYHAMAEEGPVAIKDGVTPFLAHLRGLGLRAAVATSTPTETARRLLGDVGIAHHFEAVIGGDRVRESKPHPAIYLKAAEALDVSASACLALEDSENGVRSAHAAGMTVVQIPDLVWPEEPLTPRRIVLRSLADVPAFPFDDVR